MREKRNAACGLVSYQIETGVIAKKGTRPRSQACCCDVRRDMEAVRSCDVFVAAHGAATAHFVFMRNDMALLEVYPYGFTRWSEGDWPRKFNPSMAERMGHRVRHFSLNVEDPSLSFASEHEKSGWKTAAFPPERDR